MNNISLCTAQAVAAREGLEEQLQGMQARLAGSPAGLPAGLLAHSPAAVMDSPFARHSCVLHEMQSACAELKTQNASLRAELAELRGAASRQGVSPGACASPGVVSVTADWVSCHRRSAGQWKECNHPLRKGGLYLLCRLAHH